MNFRRYRDTIIVVLLLAVPFFFLRASIRRPEEQSVVDRAIMRVAAPLEYVSAVLARNVSSLIGDYVYLVDVKKDNDKLAYENARLRDENRKLKGEAAENVRLRKLLNLKETVQAESVAAQVIGKDATEFFRVAHVTLDNPGVQVKPGMPVLSYDGTVGTVLRASGDKIDVELTVDSGFGVDVVVERTGARGFVRGIGDRSHYGVRVEYVQRNDEVDVGDMLLTSGVGCRFPKGVPVARVTKVVKRDFGMYQSVEAEPSVDFSRLEEVLIVLSDSKDCEAKGGTAGRRPRAKL
jgi:rod shape-determining protein MreC